MPFFYLAMGWQVSVEPVSFDDWETIESTSEAIEEQLRNQIACVYQGLEFPIFTPGGAAARVRVTEAK